MSSRHLARILIVSALVVGACEDEPPAAPDFSARISYDLGPPLDLPLPYGLDGNFLPVPDPSGDIVFSITDADTGRWLPSRVIFRPAPGSGFADSLTEPGPMRLEDDHRPGGRTGATVGPGVVGSTEGVMLQTGYGSVKVPPGHYHLIVTRGPEYEIAEADVDVTVGVAHGVNAELTRSVDTRGWLAADMHIHSGQSFDSRVPVDRRVISMVTNGIEVLVPTEHHGNFSFAELLSELGYGPDVGGSVAGNELNFREGHAGVYPVLLDPALPRNGSIPYQNLGPDHVCAEPQVGSNCFSAAQAFPLMRMQHPGGSLVTVNHPWWGPADLGYFTNIGWGAGTNSVFPSELSTAHLFDALEIINGYWTTSHAESYLMADWFYLLSQGHRIAALGNSDTHGINYVRAGWPRTWLRLPIDKPGEITDDLLRDAIKNQRAIASTGPFLTITIEGKQIGDTVIPNVATRTRVRIVADAPSWIALDEVYLYVNGQERGHFGARGNQRPRFSAAVDLDLDGDAFVVALATGARPLDGDIVGEYPELDGRRTYPFAVTNPIYIDADGDGQLRYHHGVSGELPWKAPSHPDEQGGGDQMKQNVPPPGFGSGRPARRECDPREQDHLPLDRMSDLMHDAAPLLYP